MISTSVFIRAAANNVLEQLAVYDLTLRIISKIDRATTRIEGVAAAIGDIAVDLGRRED